VTDLTSLSATQLVTAYRSRTATPVDAILAVFERISALNETYNAFAYFDPEAALEDARRSTLRWQKGEPLSAIDGVPATLKDLLLAKGWPTLRGSRAVDPNQPWLEDAPATARLREAGAVILGKTTTSEFGWKGIADSPLTGTTRNPWDRSRTPGGSSGGAAVAAALGFGPLHVATDGGGSTRLPAAFTGLVGYKPTFGRVPGYPSAHTGTLFHIAPLTRTVSDAALLFNLIAKPDARDWTALPDSGTDWTAGLDSGVAGLRIAFSPALGYAKVDPEIAAAVASGVKLLADRGAIVDEIDPGFEDPYPIFATLWFAAAARLLAKLPEDRRRLVEAGLLVSAENGASLSAFDFLAAQEAREALGRKLSLFHESWDLLVTPAAGTPALPAESLNADPLVRPIPTPFTYVFNLTQQPAISVPAGLTSGGLPIGLQIVGPKYADARVLRAARVIEQERAFPRLAVPN